MLCCQIIATFSGRLCKEDEENVLGLQCSECRAGTFALQTVSLLGCSPCFCFGLSQLCSELEGYVRAPIMLASNQLLLHVISQSNLKGTVEGVHFQDPDTLLDTEAVCQHVHGEPFYWRLPKQFEGDERANQSALLLPIIKGLATQWLF
ncbi:hypothetical protein ACRRTK_024754 [Alexandromys fortis]